MGPRFAHCIGTLPLTRAEVANLLQVWTCYGLGAMIFVTGRCDPLGNLAKHQRKTLANVGSLNISQKIFSERTYTWCGALMPVSRPFLLEMQSEAFVCKV